jgi:hypothetical protein
MIAARRKEVFQDRFHHAWIHREIPEFHFEVPNGRSDLRFCSEHFSPFVVRGGACTARLFFHLLEGVPDDYARVVRQLLTVEDERGLIHQSFVV